MLHGKAPRLTDSVKRRKTVSRVQEKSLNTLSHFLHYVDEIIMRKHEQKKQSHAGRKGVYLECYFFSFLCLG